MNKRNKPKEGEGIDEIITKMMKMWGLESKMKEMDLVKAWPELMGKGVAHRTESLYVRNNILHLKINSSVMRDELMYGRTVIIQRVNQFAGYNLINDVWFE